MTDGPLPEPTATELVASANPSAPGEPVAFTASVSPMPDGGTVSFTDNGEAVADCQDIALDPSGGAVCTVTYATAGAHAIVATYSGHDAFAGSVSSTLDQVVSDPTPPTPTATGLASSVNPSVPGELVTYTASVSPTPDGGTVSFTDEGAPIAECQEVAVDESGDALCAVTYATAGSHRDRRDLQRQRRLRGRDVGAARTAGHDGLGLHRGGDASVGPVRHGHRAVGERSPGQRRRQHGHVRIRFDDLVRGPGDRPGRELLDLR